MVQSNALLVDLRSLLANHGRSGVSKSKDSESMTSTELVEALKEYEERSARDSDLATAAAEIAQSVVGDLGILKKVEFASISAQNFGADLHRDAFGLNILLAIPSDVEAIPGTVLVPNAQPKIDGVATTIMVDFDADSRSSQFTFSLLAPDPNGEIVTRDVTPKLDTAQSVLPFVMLLFDENFLHSSPWIRHLCKSRRLLLANLKVQEPVPLFSQTKPEVPTLTFKDHALTAQLVTPNGIIKEAEVSTPSSEVNALLARSVRRPSR